MMFRAEMVDSVFNHLRMGDVKKKEGRLQRQPLNNSFFVFSIRLR
jgi:hypothetical protein